MKPVIRRAKVDDDIRQAIRYYQENAPEYVGKFIDSVEEAFRHISQNPGIPESGHLAMGPNWSYPGYGSGFATASHIWFFT